MLENRLISEIIHCRAHKQYAEFVCCKSDCVKQILMCQKCRPAHQEHRQAVYRITDMVNKIRANTANVSKGMKMADQDFNYFDRLIKGSQKLMRDQENTIIKRLLGELEKEKKTLFDAKKTVYKMKQKIDKQIKVLAYFKELKEKNLFEIKLKTMSGKGVQNFKEKLRCFNQIRKDPGLLQSHLSALKLRRKQLQKVIQNSLIAKVQQILSFEMCRRSSLKKTQRTNHTDKAEPQKRRNRVNSQNNLGKLNKHAVL